MIAIGTRGSDLALWQAREVARRLAVPSRLRVVRTRGDRQKDGALQGGTETGFFTKELEGELIAGRIDAAVHSLKDLPTRLDPSLRLAACLPRGQVGDLLLVHPDWYAPGGVLPLKPGCVVGAGALCRQALVRRCRPDARPTLLRGNVPTRVNKCRSGEYGAIVVARAGIERLGLEVEPLMVFRLDPAVWLPAPGQGAVAVEVRRGDSGVEEAVEAISDGDTMEAVELERMLLAAFEGGCHTAFGAHARRTGDGWKVAVGIEVPGKGWVMLEHSGRSDDCSKLGPASLDRFVVPSAGMLEGACVRFEP